MQTLSLETGAKVYCNSVLCGTLRKVVIDPRDDRITDLIVERSPTTRAGYVVPVSAVLDTGDEAVYLGLDEAELQAYPEYREAAGVDETGEPVDVAAYWPRGPGPLSRPTIQSLRQIELVGPLEEAHIFSLREAEALIARGTPVVAAGQKLGSVDRLIPDRDTHKLAYIVLHRGLIREYRVLPADRVKSISKGEVLIHGTTWDALRRYEPRDDNQLGEMIWADLVRSSTDFSGLDVDVESGVVYLGGVVHNPDNRREALDIIAALPGVVAVHSQVTTDIELMDRLIDILREQLGTLRGVVEISSALGYVTLEGQVETPALRERAERSVAAVPGVRSVNNRLEIVSCVVRPVRHGSHGVVFRVKENC